MNIERQTQISKRKLTSRELSRRLIEFSDVLAEGRWHDETTSQVHIQRRFVERIGGEYSINDIIIPPIYNDTTLGFSAHKQLLEAEDGGLIELPIFTLSSAVEQDIEAAEVPQGVLKEIVENSQYAGPISELFEEADIDEDSVNDPDIFEQFEIRRQQELEYSVLFDGEIDEYTLSYSYSFNDITLHQIDYLSATNAVATRPLIDSKGNTIDMQPVYIPALTEAAVEDHVRSLDSATEAFLIENSLKEIEKHVELPKEEHIRRIFGMLAMVSSGYKF